MKVLEASLDWWEGKDREEGRAAERRKQEDIHIERRVRFEEETRDKVRRDLERKRRLDDS